MDTSKVGVVAAQLTDKLADGEKSLGGEERVGEVMLLAEVRGTDDDGTYTYIAFRCSDEREWVQRGMLHAGLEFHRQPSDIEGEEEDS
jgi:hypothetical protein